MGGDGFGKCELASEDGRDSNLVRLDVDVGGDDGPGGVVDSLSLRERAGSAVHDERANTGRTIMFLRNSPSFFSSSCLTPGGGSLPPRTIIGFFVLSIMLVTAIWRLIKLSRSWV